MKCFIYRFLLFISIPAVLVFLSDLYLSHQDPFSYHKKYQGANNQKDSIEVLVLGNSHAKRGVDPQVFDLSGYNLANDHQSLYFDKRITLSLLDEMKQLKFVLISVDYHSFHFSSQGVRDIWSYYGHGIKYENKSYFLEEISPTLFGYPPKVLISIYYKAFLKSLFKENLQDITETGYEGLAGQNPSAFTVENYKSRAEAFNKLVQNSQREEVKNDLEDFIIILLDHGITPVLFTSPTYQEYNQYLKKSKRRKNTDDIAEMSSRLKIEYWDFMDSSLFSKSDFYDADHLNSNGARKFTTILNDSLNKFQNHYIEF